MKHDAFWFVRLFLVVFSVVLLLFLFTGCASNPPFAKAAQKEVAAPRVSETKTEIIFPSTDGSPFAPIINGDIESAVLKAVENLTKILVPYCQWTKPLRYYSDKVIIEIAPKNGAVYARARMDKSLCPEK